MKHAMQHVTVASNGCWEYGGYKIRGYPTVVRRVHGTDKKTYTSASRFFYQHHKGEIPKGLVVMHTCDNRFCCNPDHLFLGTQSDNMRDMWAKGRGPNKVGKFTAPISPEMKAAAMVLVRGGVNQAALAQALGVAGSTVTMWKVKEDAKQ